MSGSCVDDLASSSQDEDLMDACTICTDSLNQSTRAPITCIKCELVCCKRCFKRYITDPEHYLRCMGCQVEFDRTSLKSRLGQLFMRTTYRDIRESVLYDREKALLPATQALVEDQFLLERLQKERQGLERKYNEIRKQRTVALKSLRYSIEEMPASEAIDRYLQLYSAVEVIDEQLQDEQVAITDHIEQLLNDGNNSRSRSTSMRTYVLGCTKADCKGLLSRETTDLHGHYVCIICSRSTCFKCHTLVGEAGDDEHTCDPNVLKTIEFMDATSKPCPGCNVRIHKISGCFQMFCTVCLTSWDWNTRRINSGNVHNPHHTEWLRVNHNRSREIGDIPCGRDLTMDIAVSMVQSFDRQIKLCLSRGQLATEARNCSSYMFNAMRMSIHHHTVTMPSLARLANNQSTNESLRVDLLRGYISEPDFKREIQRRDKNASRKADLLNVVTTYRDALIDIIWPFAEHPRSKTIDQWMTMVKELRALEEYVNECFVRVFETFGSNASFEILSDRNLR